MLVQPHPERIKPCRQRRRFPHARQPTPAEVVRFGERYADLRDRRLAHLLIAEDAAEDREELSPFERISCHTHRRWAHECISSPIHVIVVTGHRWCPQCEAQATVAIDELRGDVSVICRRCHKSPDTAATRQILRTCRKSLAAAFESRRAHDAPRDASARHLR